MYKTVHPVRMLFSSLKILLPQCHLPYVRGAASPCSISEGATFIFSLFLGIGVS